MKHVLVVLAWAANMPLVCYAQSLEQFDTDLNAAQSVQDAASRVGIANKAQQFQDIPHDSEHLQLAINVFCKAASLCFGAQAYRDAIPLYGRALDLIDNLESSTTLQQEMIYALANLRASMLINIAHSYLNLGNHSSAKPSFEQAIQAALRTPDHAVRGRAYAAMADYYCKQKNFDDAIGYYEMAKHALSSSLKNQQRDEYVAVLDRYANCCYGTGHQAQAATLLEEAITDASNNHLEKSVDFGRVLRDASIIDDAFGRSDRSRERLFAASDILKPGTPEGDYLQRLIGRKFALGHRNNYAFVDTLYSVQLITFDRANMTPVEKVETLCEMGLFYIMHDKIDRALDLLKRANAAAGDNAALKAQCQSIIDLAHLRTGDFEAAFKSICNLCYQDLESFWQKSNRLNEVDLTTNLNLPGMSAREFVFSLIPLIKEHHPSSQTDLYFAMSQRKGLVQDRMRQFYRQVRQSKDHSIKRKLSIYHQYLAQATAVVTVLDHISGVDKDGAMAKDVEHCFNGSAKLQAKMMTKLADPLSDQIQSVADLQKSIPQDSVVFDYYKAKVADVRFLGVTQNPAEIGKDHYYLFVLTHDLPASVFDLGDSASIEQSISAFRTNIDLARAQVDEAQRAALNTQLKSTLRTLYKRVLAPALCDCPLRSKTFFCPTGDLNTLPFETLIGSDDKYLIESQTVEYLESIGDLVRPADAGLTRPRKMLFVFRPDYTFTSKSITAKELHLYRTHNPKSWPIDHPWPPLRSGQMMNGLQKDISKVAHIQALTEDKASEERTKQLASRADVVHISSHGYWSNDTSSDNAKKNLSDESLAMMKSGIVLARANQLQYWQDGEPMLEDGYLTAFEMAGLNLEHVKLIFLDACDTGAGLSSNGEGVYGLRRAVRLAGTQSAVLSLFQIPDLETSELANRFYGRFFQDGDEAAALRAAKLPLISRHPLYWAGLIAEKNCAAQ